MRFYNGTGGTRRTQWIKVGEARAELDPAVVFNQFGGQLRGRDLSRSFGVQPWELPRTGVSDVLVRHPGHYGACGVRRYFSMGGRRHLPSIDILMYLEVAASSTTAVRWRVLIVSRSVIPC